MVFDFSSIFNRKPAAPEAPSQAVVNNTTVPQPDARTSDGSNPAFPAVPSSGAGSPMEGYKDLWQAPSEPVVAPTSVPNIVMDPAKITEAASKINFAAHLNPELVDKALGGDRAAFLEVVNGTAQAGFSAAVQNTGLFIQKALEQQQAKFNTEVAPAMLREHDIRNSVSTNIPISTNPAAKPIVDLLTNQITGKYPTASPGEVKAMVDSYLNNLADTIVTNNGGQVLSKASVAAAKPADTDWSKFLVN